MTGTVADTLCPFGVAPAVQLYKDAGVPTRRFVGVPVFQAEGLTVTTQDTVSFGDSPTGPDPAHKSLGQAGGYVRSAD